MLRGIRERISAGIINTPLCTLENELLLWWMYMKTTFYEVEVLKRNSLKKSPSLW